MAFHCILYLMHLMYPNSMLVIFKLLIAILCYLLATETSICFALIHICYFALSRTIQGLKLNLSRSFKLMDLCGHLISSKKVQINVAN